MGSAAGVSRPRPLGIAAASLGLVEGGGGGSMTDGASDGFDRGSGRAGIGSSAEDVSMVMCFVVGGDVLRV